MEYFDDGSEILGVKAILETTLSIFKNFLSEMNMRTVNNYYLLGELLLKHDINKPRGLAYLKKCFAFGPTKYLEIIE